MIHTQDLVGPEMLAELAPPARTRQQLGARHVESVLQENLQVDRRPLNVRNVVRILTRPRVVQYASAMEGFLERVTHAQVLLSLKCVGVGVRYRRWRSCGFWCWCGCMRMRMCMCMCTYGCVRVRVHV